MDDDPNISKNKRKNNRNKGVGEGLLGQYFTTLQYGSIGGICQRN
jgi:hypothetical protein